MHQYYRVPERQDQSMTGTANFSQHYNDRLDPRSSTSYVSSDQRPSTHNISRQSHINPLQTNTADFYRPHDHQFAPQNYTYMGQYDGQRQSESEGESCESEEEEFEDEESEGEYTQTEGSLSDYHMSEEMKGFYKQQNMEIARSSMASGSQSIMSNPYPPPGMRQGPQNYNPATYSVPDARYFPSVQEQRNSSKGFQKRPDPYRS